MIVSDEISPIDGRKSFGGKAREFSDKAGNTYLLSYSTIVAKVDPEGRLYVRGEYSLTTNRHVYAFAAKHGIWCRDIKDMRKVIAESKEEDFLLEESASEVIA